MKRHLSTLSASIVLAIGVATPVGAHLEIESPSGGTVGRTFTLTGVAEPTCNIDLTIGGMSYFPPAFRGQEPEFFSYTAAQTDNSGRFTIPVDLNGAQVRFAKGDGMGAGAPLQGLPAGTHLFVVSGSVPNGVSVGDCGNGSKAEVTLTVQDAAPVAQKPTSATTAPTQTPSITPVVSESPASEIKGASLDPGVALALGALIGAALLSLAEVSALEYRRKHGKKALKK